MDAIAALHGRIQHVDAELTSLEQEIAQLDNQVDRKVRMHHFLLNVS